MVKSIVKTFFINRGNPVTLPHVCRRRSLFDHTFPREKRANPIIGERKRDYSLVYSLSQRDTKLTRVFLESTYYDRLNVLFFLFSSLSYVPDNPLVPGFSVQSFKVIHRCLRPSFFFHWWMNFFSRWPKPLFYCSLSLLTFLGLFISARLHRFFFGRGL